MDVLDAGVYVTRFEAAVPKGLRTVLWGPLQARELGLDGWEVQDGGETGYVFHNPGVSLTMGRATSTLIVVRRLARAFLTVYLGGYPADAPASQRRMDMQKVVSACELFLGRIARETVRFEMTGEWTLVDNLAAPSQGAPAPASKPEAAPDATTRPVPSGASGPSRAALWEI